MARFDFDIVHTKQNSSLNKIKNFHFTFLKCVDMYILIDV